jgi:uncharacterized protein (DUF2141 family)
MRRRFHPLAINLLFGSILFALVCKITPAQQPAEGPPTNAATKSTLIIHVSGIRSTKGKIGVALWRDAKGFPEEVEKYAAEQQYVDIDAKTMTALAVFKDVPRGVCAVTVLHDENNNHKFDKSLIGVPKEGYGMSNNPPKRMGPPKFDEAKFALDQPEKTIEIKLIYW